MSELPCDGGCNYNSGPEETCSAHGCPVAEVWDIVQGISAERDAALRLAQEANDDCRKWEGLLQEAKVERDAALAVIEKAPHGSDCQRLQVMPTAVQIVDGTWQDGECSCWKSSVDTSALAERDAETLRAAAEHITHDHIRRALLARADALAVKGAELPKEHRDTDRHGAWDKAQQRYEDGSKSHPCGLRCALAEKGADQ